VLNQLEFDPSIDAAGIGVAVHGGVATLTGHVPTYQQKAAAEAAAKMVRGVVAVAEDIEVRPPGAPPADDEVARNAALAIAYDTALPEEGIMIEVAHGRVTLTGEVDWDYQRAAADADVRQIHGVRAVDNQLTLKQRPPVAGVKAKIKQAFARDAVLRACRIHIRVLGHRVTLEGVVHSLCDRDMARRLAWSAPGVRSVHDLIEVR
jgi:osmotically-inducible protein OsmY